MKHNPYRNIEWNSWEQIKSCSHMHVLTQDNFDWAVINGYRHIASTRYSPVSAPIYPLDTRFVNIPENVLGSPSSEKFQLSDATGHYNTLGSFLAGYGYETATEDRIPWKQMFDEAFNELQFVDGGGITYNHPPVADSSFDMFTEMLDYDERVLGMEVYHNGMEVDQFSGYYKDRYLPFWDRILSTGRRCYGFGAVDWIITARNPWYGSNILLVPAFTEHDCLKAYRNGQFYVIANDTGLRFENLIGDDMGITVSINRSANIRFISERGVEKEGIGTTGTFTDISGRTFVRVEVIEDGFTDSILLSNPFMYKNKEQVEEENKGEDTDKIKKMMRNIILFR